MVVQQHVLNWLYSVLTSEYNDVNRTYNDVAQTLSQYPSLSPRTDVHTFDNGASALLVHLSGTIPVVFRGTTYRFPISLWVPHAYPREAPLAYVTPTETMMVRPGQHVDPQGRVYHPYLVGWAEFWDKSSILDFVAILRDIFAKEPPVIARQQTMATQPSMPNPPPVPPLPQELSRTLAQTQPPNINDGRPPPPPPKGSDAPQVVPGQPTNASGPPLPPLPPGIRQQQQQGQYSNEPYQQTPNSSRYDSAPPLPLPQPQELPPNSQQGPAAPPPTLLRQAAQHFQHQGQQQIYSPSTTASGYAPPQELRNSTSTRSQDAYRDGNHRQPPGYQGVPPDWRQEVPRGTPQQLPASTQVRPPRPPDIMDEQLTLALPTPPNLPPPPIPPNPEKDALLHQLAATLFALRQRSRAQNESSLAGLAAQRNAMLAALKNLQNDSAALTPISNLLGSNTAVLQQSLQEAGQVISNSRKLPPPGIDDLLVAPTVVGNQLYDVVAEERALGDAIFVLGRAVEKGRMTPQVFAKTTRSLAREWYLKKALAKKIGHGMGLVA